MTMTMSAMSAMLPPTTPPMSAIDTGSTGDVATMLPTTVEFDRVAVEEMTLRFVVDVVDAAVVDRDDRVEVDEMTLRFEDDVVDAAVVVVVDAVIAGVLETVIVAVGVAVGVKFVVKVAVDAVVIAVIFTGAVALFFENHHIRKISKYRR